MSTADTRRSSRADIRRTSTTETAGAGSRRVSTASVPEVRKEVVDKSMVRVMCCKKKARLLKWRMAKAKEKAEREKKERAEVLEKKREEAERKARRGEIDPTHEFTFHIIAQIAGIMRQDIIQFVLNDPIILDELDYLYKTDTGRKMLFFYQPKAENEEEEETEKTEKVKRQPKISVTEKQKKPEVKRVLFTSDGFQNMLVGPCSYFLRLTTRRALGEETFQRDILAGMIEGSVSENILWNIERIITMIFIPILNSACMKNKGSTLAYKIKKELLPCLRSFTSSLRVAEKVCGEGLLIESFPPESYKIKCIEDSWAFLATEGGQARFEESVREWMKNIYEVLLESEQLRLETDNAGPQEELEYWKSRAARLSLLVDQVSSDPCKLTIATLRCAQCKLVKVSSE